MTAAIYAALSGLPGDHDVRSAWAAWCVRLAATGAWGEA